MQTAKIISSQWTYVIYLVANASRFGKPTGLGVHCLYLR